MSDTAPLTGPMSRHDAMLLSKMAYAQASEALSLSATYLLAISATIATATRPQALGLGSSYVVGQTDDITVFVFTGTDNVYQWIGHLLGSGLGPWGPGAGLVGTYFSLNALYNWTRVEDDLPTDKAKRVVFCGHSLGGAIAEILAANAMLQGWTNVGLYVLGCPKVGNAAWVNQLLGFGGDVQQLVNQYDVVPSLPPPASLPWLSSYLFSLGSAALNYAPIPDAILQQTYGDWTPTLLPNMDNLTLITLMPSAEANHGSATYIARASALFGTDSDLLPGAMGYSQPCVLLDQTQGTAGCGGSLPPGDTLPKNLLPDPGQTLAQMACNDVCNTPQFITKPLT